MPRSPANRAPGRFQVQWQNEFLKAQRGTFVPFTLRIDARGSRSPRPSFTSGPSGRTRRFRRGAFRNERATAVTRPAGTALEDEFAVEAIFPAELAVEPGQIARISRGFTVAAGAYDAVSWSCASVQPRAERRAEGRGRSNRAWSSPISGPRPCTSSVILADRLDVAARNRPAGRAGRAPLRHRSERHHPGSRPNTQRKTEELIVVFLVYNPFVTPERQFDLQVEYHFFRRSPGGREASPAGGADRPPARDGRAVFQPYRSAAVQPGDPGRRSSIRPAGQPVMAGQGVRFRVSGRRYRLAHPGHGFAGGDVNRARRFLHGRVVAALRTEGEAMRHVRSGAHGSGHRRVHVRRRLLACLRPAQTIRIPGERSRSGCCAGAITGTVSDEARRSAGRRDRHRRSARRGRPRSATMPASSRSPRCRPASTSFRHISRASPDRLADRPRRSTGGTLPQPLLLRSTRAAGRHDGHHPPVYARPILAAGFALPAGNRQQPKTPKDAESADEHPHTRDRVASPSHQAQHPEGHVVGRRARRARRAPDRTDGSAVRTRAFDSAANFAATFFTDLPFSGEVNVLTTSALAPGALFSG